MGGAAFDCALCSAEALVESEYRCAEYEHEYEHEYEKIASKTEARSRGEFGGSCQKIFSR